MTPIARTALWRRFALWRRSRHVSPWPAAEFEQLRRKGWRLVAQSRQAKEAGS